MSHDGPSLRRHYDGSSSSNPVNQYSSNRLSTRRLRPRSATLPEKESAPDVAPPSRRDVRRSYYPSPHTTTSTNIAAVMGNPSSLLTAQGALPQHYLHTRTMSRLPNSEPIYHDIEQERQQKKRLVSAQGLPPRPSLPAPLVSTPEPSPLRAVRHRTPLYSQPTVVEERATSTRQQQFRPAQLLELPTTLRLRTSEQVKKDRIKETLVMYGDAFEQGSVLTGLSRQELLRSGAFSNDEIKKRKEKKYGKKKKKDRILNLPLSLTTRGPVNDDWPRYSRGADESSEVSALAFRIAQRRSRLQDRWVSRRFVSDTPLATNPANRAHKSPEVSSRLSEDLTSATSSQGSPHLPHGENDGTFALTKSQGSSSEINDHQVEAWLVSSRHQTRQMDGSSSPSDDEYSFPFLSTNVSSGVPPDHYDSINSSLSGAATDQAVADSTEISKDTEKVRFADKQVARNGARSKSHKNRNKKDAASLSGEKQTLSLPRELQTMWEEVNPNSFDEVGNDSPTSVLDVPIGHRQSAPSPPLTKRQFDVDPSPPRPTMLKSILRNKTLRFLYTDCPSDEGMGDDRRLGHFPTRKREKTVRIVDAPTVDLISKSPPPDESAFKDVDGMELSPIQPERPALISRSPVTTSEGDVYREDGVGRNISLPVAEQWNAGREHATGRHDPVDADREFEPEAGEESVTASEGYAFIEEVATIVIQTAYRQFVAKQRVLGMLETSFASNPEEDFNDMTYRMYHLAAIQIQSVYRGWWIRDLLSVDHYCATLIQQVFRGFLYRNNYHFDLYRIILIQSIYRRNRDRDAAVERLSCVLTIQAAFRGYRTRLMIMNYFELGDEREQKDWAATKIQARWRGCVAQMQYLHRLADILIVQSIARLWITKRVVLPYLQSNTQKEKKLSSRTGKVNHKIGRSSRAVVNPRGEGKTLNIASGTIDNRSDKDSRKKVDSNHYHRVAVRHEGRERGSQPICNEVTIPPPPVDEHTLSSVESRSDRDSGTLDLLKAWRVRDKRSTGARK